MTYTLLQTDTAKLDVWLETYRSSIHPQQAYRPPSTAEVDHFIEDLDRALEGETNLKHLSKLGYSAKQGYDKISDKSYILLENEYDTERSWGAYIIETSRTPKHVIAAPHPKADKNSEGIALDLWRETPGAVYMVAGTHRLAVSKNGDVTRHAESLFHKVGAHLAHEGLSHTQLHGFKDGNSPDEDIIISAADTPVTDTHRAIVDEVASSSVRVGTSWNGKSKPLRGYVNQLGKALTNNNSPFMHIEINRSTRDDADTLKKLLPAIARGLRH